MSSQLPDVIRGEESCDEDTEDDARSSKEPPRSSKEPLRSSKEPPLERMSSQEPKTSVTSSSSSGQGMSRSVSDTTLRKHALHLNLSQSVLPSFTPLHQFKVCKVYKDSAQAAESLLTYP